MQLSGAKSGLLGPVNAITLSGVDRQVHEPEKGSKQS